jgi:hypothetical protein
VFLPVKELVNVNVQEQFWETADLRVDGCSSQEAVAVCQDGDGGNS